MSDVFAIEVVLPKGTYPSVNHIGRDGFRGGRKTREAKELAQSVFNAAKAEMIRTEWMTATTNVECHFTRYVSTRRIVDCGNMFKVEADALQAAGVVENDTLIRPLHLAAEYDPDGVDRISIVLLRRYAPMTGADPSKLRGARKPKPLPPVTVAPVGGTAYVNGKPATYGEALREAGLTADVTDRRRAR